MWGKDSNPYSLLRGMQPAAVTMESVWRSPQKSRKRFTIDPVVPPLDVISKYFFYVLVQRHLFISLCYVHNGCKMETT